MRLAAFLCSERGEEPTGHTRSGEDRGRGQRPLSLFAGWRKDVGPGRAPGLGPRVASKLPAAAKEVATGEKQSKRDPRGIAAPEDCRAAEGPNRLQTLRSIRLVTSW